MPRNDKKIKTLTRALHGLLRTRELGVINFKGENMNIIFKITIALFFILSVFSYSQDHEINIAEVSLLGKKCPEITCEKFFNGKTDLKSNPKLIYFMQPTDMIDFSDDETKKLLIKSKKHMNDLNDALSEKKIKIEIIGIMSPYGEVVENEKEFLKYIKAENIKHIIGIDKTNEKGHQLSAIAFNRGQIPFLFLVNKENKIVWEGDPLKIDLEKITKKLQDAN